MPRLLGSQAKLSAAGDLEEVPEYLSGGILGGGGGGRRLGNIPELFLAGGANRGSFWL